MKAKMISGNGQIKFLPKRRTKVESRDEMNAVTHNVWLKVVGYIAMLIALLLILIPIYWIVIASFKTQGDIYTSPATYWPNPWTIENYQTVREDLAFGAYLRNSIIITVVLSTIKIILGVASAYALALLRFPGRNLVFMLIIASLMVPSQITLISNYSLIANLGLRNTFIGIILPLAGTAFGTFLMRNHFLSLPKEVIESARMDGAGPLKLLFRIVLPMSWSTLSAFALITIVNDWNEYLWPFLMSDDEATAPLQIGLTFLQNNEGLTNWGPVMAGTVLAVIPVLIVFLLLQKNMIKGLTSGAVKG
ncbi:carbohydrate ABC transporter permease [Arcanobacterium hippocoleae]|uniref:Sn-glycerol 3-phosphate transport system permease protein n=1 Tax=Arcanobacterium hippocoleae TaxID=149017 RepID=A0ABU1T436_9ACTO|nr:carbohydrate ABC transporter permease [Arcanobacterium hippocoleae]MDR6940078.1 sn-glycerol 3-phosphate transport system permease protein [Arcanobacterium hippocoleae]